MASDIDATKPLDAEGFAGDMRANFAAAKFEIEALQTITTEMIVWGGLAAGTANNITLTPTPSLTSYFGGLVVLFIATADNTAGTTLNVNSLGQRALRRDAVTSIGSAEIRANHLVAAVYDDSANIFKVVGISGDLRVTSTGNPQMLVLANGEGTPKYLLQRINAALGAANTNYELQIDGSGNFVIRDNTNSSQRVELSTSGDWSRSSANTSGKLGTASRRWAELHAELALLRSTSQNPSYTVTAQGDLFPALNLLRESGSGFTNYSWQINVSQDGNFVFRDMTAGVNRLTMFPDGTLELGEPVISRRFISEVEGDLFPAIVLRRTGASGFTNRDWRMNVLSDGTLQFQDETAGGGRLQISTNGHVRPAVDNDVPCGDTAHRWTSVWSVNGTLQTSDEREKTDIEDSDLGLEFIEKLRPVSYRWKDGGPKHYGLIAQQMEAVLNGREFGGLHHDDESDRYSLIYTDVIAPLVASVQTLSAKNTALESTVESLSARVAKLEAQLS